MFRSTFVVASLVAVAMMTRLVAADTPANCTYEDIRGTWMFSIGPTGLDRTVNCSEPWKTASTLTVQLVFPDVAVDEDGNKGFWTMIYNQGFEVQIGYRKYFAFSYYTNTTSVCSTTLNGWSHDFWGHNWACYSGAKTDSSSEPRKHSGGTNPERKYVENKEFIEQINKQQSMWKAASYPELSKLTLKDLQRRAGGTAKLKLPSVAPPSDQTLMAAGNLPDFFDWRNVSNVNYVSPIRNQGQCGSCYSFASMAMLESRLRIATGNKLQVVLSPQDVVSCSEYAQGCEGGFPYLIAGKYAEDFGVVEESCFPYLGEDSPCKKESGCLRYYSTNYYYVGGFYGACNEPEMRLELVNNGPVAIGFEVYKDFVNYKGGIYHHTTLLDKFNPWEITNHAVLVVGYGTENGVAYWIVKNSWGEEWGEEGYFRIRRGNDECGMESMAMAATPLVP